MNDKEKIEKSLEMIHDLIELRQSYHEGFVTSDQPDKTELLQRNLNDLQNPKIFLSIHFSYMISHYK